MRIINWRPELHPRNRLGQFREVLGRLKSGDKVRLPDNTMVERRPSGRFRISAPGQRGYEVASVKTAARAGLNHGLVSRGGDRRKAAPKARKSGMPKSVPGLMTTVASDRQAADITHRDPVTGKVSRHRALPIPTQSPGTEAKMPQPNMTGDGARMLDRNTGRTGTLHVGRMTGARTFTFDDETRTDEMGRPMKHLVDEDFDLVPAPDRARVSAPQSPGTDRISSLASKVEDLPEHEHAYEAETFLRQASASFDRGELDDAVDRLANAQSIADGIAMSDVEDADSWDRFARDINDEIQRVYKEQQRREEIELDREETSPASPGTPEDTDSLSAQIHELVYGSSSRFTAMPPEGSEPHSSFDYPLDMSASVPSLAHAVKFLKGDKEQNLRVPASRWAWDGDTNSAIETAVQVAYARAAVSGEPLTYRELDEVMSSVVNDSDGIAHDLYSYVDGPFAGYESGREYLRMEHPYDYRMLRREMGDPPGIGDELDADDLDSLPVGSLVTRDGDSFTREKEGWVFQGASPDADRVYPTGDDFVRAEFEPELVSIGKPDKDQMTLPEPPKSPGTTTMLDGPEALDRLPAGTTVRSVDGEEFTRFPLNGPGEGRWGMTAPPSEVVKASNFFGEWTNEQLSERGPFVLSDVPAPKSPGTDEIAGVADVQGLSMMVPADHSPYSGRAAETLESAIAFFRDGEYAEASALLDELRATASDAQRDAVRETIHGFGGNQELADDWADFSDEVRGVQEMFPSDIAPPASPGTDRTVLRDGTDRAAALDALPVGSEVVGAEGVRYRKWDRASLPAGVEPDPGNDPWPTSGTWWASDEDFTHAMSSRTLAGWAGDLTVAAPPASPGTDEVYDKVSRALEDKDGRDWPSVTSDWSSEARSMGADMGADASIRPFFSDPPRGDEPQAPGSVLVDHVLLDVTGKTQQDLVDYHAKMIGAEPGSPEYFEVDNMVEDAASEIYDEYMSAAQEQFDASQMRESRLWVQAMRRYGVDPDTLT